MIGWWVALPATTCARKAGPGIYFLLVPVHYSVHIETRRDSDMTKTNPVAACQWFAKCDNPATTTQSHPILGSVPVCQCCADWYKRMAAK